jgi:hypothetical protein
MQVVRPRWLDLLPAAEHGSVRHRDADMKHDVVQAILAAIEQEWSTARLTLTDGTKLDGEIIGLASPNDRPHIQLIESNRVKHLPVDDIAEVVKAPLA